MIFDLKPGFLSQRRDIDYKQVKLSSLHQLGQWYRDLYPHLVRKKLDDDALHRADIAIEVAGVRNVLEDTDARAVTGAKDLEVEKLTGLPSEFLTWLSRVNTSASISASSETISTHLIGGTRDPPTSFEMECKYNYGHGISLASYGSGALEIHKKNCLRNPSDERANSTELGRPQQSTLRDQPLDLKKLVSTRQFRCPTPIDGEASCQ